MSVPPDVAGFFDHAYPRVVGLLSLYCGDRWVAEELAQEAFIRAFSRWGRVGTLHDPVGWVQRVAMNLANSHLRRLAAERRARARLDSRPDSHVEVEPDARLALSAALASLPKRQRAAVVLRYYADKSFAEIGEVMECPEPTARSLVHRGLKRLRSAYPDTQTGIDNVVEVPLG